MSKKNKILLLLAIISFAALSMIATAFADSVDDVGGTGQGNISGTNVYTFSYLYRSDLDAIVLKVDAEQPFYYGASTYTYESMDDKQAIHTKNPRLGSSLDSAVASMNAAGGYNLSVDDVKAVLISMGYYDKGNGVWKTDDGYLTYISAVKIRPQKHTVAYNANGGTGAPGSQTKDQGVTLTLSSTKPTRTGYTFKYWNASIGGTYNPGGSYTHDQNGGTVTMTAYWVDETAPSCSTFTATPNTWSSGNGSVTIKAKDEGSGISSIVLKRYSYVTGTWSDIQSWTSINSTSEVTKTYSQTTEGVYMYQVVITDGAGNTTTINSSAVYLDHTKPVISGAGNTVTSWTNVAPVISVSATDYLSGTTYNGSGVASIVIKNSSGAVVASGTASTSYTLTSSDEGIRTWTIVAKDNVGWETSTSVTTKYDKSGPNCSTFSATPNDWSNGNGTVSIKAKDSYSGISSIELKRYSYVTSEWSTIKSWTDINSTNDVSKSYSQTEEGVYMYQVIITDLVGNTTTKNSSVVYLDHTKPVINGVSSTVTDWTNIAPVINVTATDYLSGTSYKGSGLYSLVIKDEAGNVVGNGTTSASYTLADKYEGIYIWTIVAKDNVGWETSTTVTTKFDKTSPSIDGTETVYVKPDGTTVSGYCKDNIIKQHIDDKPIRSVNSPNVTSGLKSVIIYKYYKSGNAVLYGDKVKKTFTTSDTNSYFDVYYEMLKSEKDVMYYLIIAQDFAGNTTRKKLVGQQSVLNGFHTSIERKPKE